MRSVRAMRVWIPLLVGLHAAASPAWADESGADAAIRFTASNLFSTAEGTFHGWRIVETTIDPADPAGSSVVVEIDLASVDTGIEARDDHLRTADFFDVASYPTATVRVHGAQPIEPDAAGRERYRASFDVDLHGVQKTLPGQFTLMSRDPLVVEGALTLNRLDFGIGPPQRFWNPMSITEEVPISFRAAIPR